MPRKIRYILPQIPHHAVQRGNNRQNIFLDEEDKDYFLENLKTISSKNNVSIGAYCLMINHFHLLLYPESKEGLIILMKLISQHYSQYINKKYKRSGKLWENRYKLHIVDPNYEWVVARYIEQNPIRANIVKRAEDYKYSSALAHLKGMRDNVLTKDLLKRNSTEEYKVFFNENMTQEKSFLDNMRLILNQEKILGSKEFIRQAENCFKTSFELKKRGRPLKLKIK